MVGEVSAETFESHVLKAPGPILVEVWAPWCGPCQAMAPVLADVAEQFQGQAQVFKLNADANSDLVRHYKVLGIPTLLFFRHGYLVDKKMGVQPAAAIGKRLTALLDLTPQEAASREITGLFRWPGWLKKLTGQAS